jgi:hypothetical protein
MAHGKYYWLFRTSQWLADGKRINYCWLQEQLQASQEAMKIAKAESARRLKSLQSLQQQVSQDIAAVQLLIRARLLLVGAFLLGLLHA